MIDRARKGNFIYYVNGMIYSVVFGHIVPITEL